MLASLILAADFVWQEASRSRRETHQEQVRVLLDAAKGDHLEALYVLAVTTGLRQGELLGLKWDDIDLQVGTLQVRRTLTTAKGGPVLSAPKTKGSRRTVRLSQTALEALRSHPGASIGGDRPGRQSVARERPHIRVGSRGAAGPPLHYHAPLQALLKRTGLPQIRFHDLRHTCATLLLAQNVNPKVVPEMLGHATLAITLDTYSHVLPNMQDSAARALEEALR